jgi:hypothetical protein
VAADRTIAVEAVANHTMEPTGFEMVAVAATAVGRWRTRPVVVLVNDEHSATLKNNRTSGKEKGSQRPDLR